VTVILVGIGIFPGTGTGMGKLIQKQAKMERISQHSTNEKPLF